MAAISHSGCKVTDLEGRGPERNECDPDHAIIVKDRI
jgi:hypothetical protein